MHGQNFKKCGVVDVEKLGRKLFKLTYWNEFGMIAAVGIYDIMQGGIHLIDCNNPYDSESDRKVIEGMSKMKFFCDLPFEEPPEWVKNAQAEIKLKF